MYQDFSMNRHNIIKTNLTKGFKTMKNWNDIAIRLKNELIVWYARQCKNPFTDFYLYYTKSTNEHNSGLIIKSENKNPDNVLVMPGRINKSQDIESNYNRIINSGLLQKLPILDRI